MPVRSTVYHINTPPVIDAKKKDAQLLSCTEMKVQDWN